MIHPAPRWRDYVLPVLYPTPGGASAVPRSFGWIFFWILLTLVLIAGVLAPYVAPDTVREWTQPTSKPGSISEIDPGIYPPGTRLRDCRDDSCPWLVVIPGGSFTMGSPDNERDRSANEGPGHEVTISDRFAVMETEVTRGQFAAFIKETQYAHEGGCYYWDGTQGQLDPQRSWQNPGFEQTDQHPVVCVNWNDAQAYAKWLSQKTRQHYRLPSEAEWEYVARAGTQTRFWFGDKDEDLCTYGNVADRSTKAGWKEWNKSWSNAECNDGRIFTAPVKSFKPNAYGLYDVNGNAWEWTQDCWHDNYQGAPSDGSAWESDCVEKHRVVRGGGWINYPQLARSAYRDWITPVDRNVITGFRLARTLTSLNFTTLPFEQRNKQ